MMTVEQRILSRAFRRSEVTKTLSDLDIGLSASSLQLQILPPAPALSPKSIGLLWHRVDAPQGIEITIASQADRYQFVRLRLSCPTANFGRDWFQWHYVPHRTSELEGGAAVDALDRTSDDGEVLWLIVPPSRDRAAVVEFDLSLSREVRVGNYPMTISVTVDPDGFEPYTTDFDVLLELRHPPSGLLGHLPAVYQDAMMSEALLGQSDDGFIDRPFFERFLRGFDDFLQPLQETLDRLADLFGPESAPPLHVLWLATWVCAPMDQNWSEMKRRQLIRVAVDLFRWRGTKRGLARYLKIYTDVDPVIDDQPTPGMVLSDYTFLGTEDTILGDIEPHTFSVTIATDALSDVNEDIVREIIDFEKPAHTAYTLRIVRNA
jgi:phage tail-like protein